MFSAELNYSNVGHAHSRDVNHDGTTVINDMLSARADISFGIDTSIISLDACAVYCDELVWVCTLVCAWGILLCV